MIHTGVLYISCIWFLPEYGPARAKTCRRRVVVVVVVVVVVICNYNNNNNTN